MAEDLTDRIVDLHDHLAATQERPVERGASRWIGEAEAVARDLRDRPADEAVLRERLGHVEGLLANVDTTEDRTADEHVAAAKRLVGDLLADLRAGDR